MADVSIANDNGEPAWVEELAEQVLTDESGNGNEGGQLPIVVTATSDGLDATLTWAEDFSDVGVEVRWGDGTDPVYSDSPATHSYLTAGTYAATVDPYGDENPAANVQVTVTDPA